MLKCSSWYLTEPVGLDDPEWFVNAVALLETPLAPEDLMRRLLEIETALGRERTVKWGPRVIDLDLLAYDEVIISQPGLTLPHPFLEKRRFVLEPMGEIAPDYIHPVLRKTIAELRRDWRGEGQDLIRMTD
ncbi:MAG: 2-amino-4-hydroxy-6-hydroxymethyldihydropteridine diphosphokinase [Thermodesulfobacteriota bacterium]